jgi:membrane protein DedA with SNARE-associated domain
MARAPEGRPSRLLRRAVIGLLGLSFAAGVVGNVFMPLLLRRSPVLLLAIQSSYAQMGLAAARLDPVTFVAVAALRRWLGEVLAFAGGRVLGTQILDWYQRRGGRAWRPPEALHTTWAPARDLAVVLLPHPLLSAFFGTAGMAPRRFVILKLIGSVVTVAAFWSLAGVASVPLTTAADFVEDNARRLTLAAAGLGVLWLTWQRRRPEPAVETEGADTGDPR